MQPCNREMVGMNNNNNSNNNSSLLNHTQIPSLVQQDNHLHNHHAQPSHFHHAPPPSDDFLDQMFSSLPPCSWTDLNPNMLPITEPATSAADDVGGFHHPPPHGLDDQSAILVSKLRQQQISGSSGGGGGPSSSAAAARALMLQQQLLGHPNNGIFDGSAVYHNNNGFGGSSLHGVAGQTSTLQRPHFNHSQGQGGSIQQQVTPNFSAQGQGTVTNQGASVASASTGGAPGQPKQRVRARRGQATDPHSIAERLRRERIAERMKALQELVPNANKTDKASMLDEIIDYVKFLQLQVKVLSMSRLGGAAAVAPLVADVTSEGGGDCNQASPNGNNNDSSNDSLTVTEHQVAKLMEEDMGSAMQYLQGKGLCLMPISLATAISTATCRSGRPVGNNGVHASNAADGPTSPSMSVLTVQSATNLCNGNVNGGVDVSVKDAASVSKP